MYKRHWYSPPAMLRVRRTASQADRRCLIPKTFSITTRLGRPCRTYDSIRANSAKALTHHFRRLAEFHSIRFRELHGLQRGEIKSRSKTPMSII
eukprot:76719-Prymnesium_polylepis.3